MATFIALLTLPNSESADEGSLAHKLEEGAPETRKVLEAHGGKLVSIYLTMGQFDGVAVMEFPNTVACAQAMMAFRERFGGGTQTMEAFPESQWAELAQGI